VVKAKASRPYQGHSPKTKAKATILKAKPRPTFCGLRPRPRKTLLHHYKNQHKTTP